jgi:NAD(P)-dependent dehydrogenase (short-subunit alcohol dehydrogenase family)
MARILVTGSADGLGFLAAERLVKEGHEVVLHARSEERASDARRRLPRAQHVVVGDVATIAAMKDVARQANEIGAFDAVVHNVAIGYLRGARSETSDGLEQHFAVNTLAPYVLTALVPARRLVYLSSGMHHSGRVTLDDPQWTKRRWSGSGAYSDTKLQDLWLAFGVARRWPSVRSNAVEPGWVPTKMGGPGAPDDLAEGAATQAWLAVSDDREALGTGGYFYHRKPASVLAAAHDAAKQDELLALCEALSGETLRSEH